MCFSAEASLVAALATGAAGAAALARTDNRLQWPLAAMPLFFAAQQTTEGALWLSLPVDPTGPAAALETHIFLLFAVVLWPIYAPASVWLIEPDDVRRRLIGACITCGVVVSAYFVVSLSAAPQFATIDNGHIVYSGDPNMPDSFRLLYPVAICGGAAFSSYRTIRLLALILIVESLVAFVFYRNAFSSVWCYFAAAASCVIVLQFEQARRQRRAQMR